MDYELSSSGHIVVADECMFIKCKYNRGRRQARQIRIFGMVDCTTKLMIFRIVPDQSKPTLQDLITQFRFSDTKLWTDCWKGYTTGFSISLTIILHIDKLIMPSISKTPLQASAQIAHRESLGMPPQIPLLERCEPSRNWKRRLLFG